MKKFILSVAFALFSLFVNNIFAADYNLWIAEVQVTDDNKSNIVGEGISGNVSYNSITNVLTLDNATIEHNNASIVNEIENLTINIIGINTLHSSREQALWTKANMTIEGNGFGALNITCDQASAIYHQNCNLTIARVNVTANGRTYGICGHSGQSEVLTIDEATVKATGQAVASIADINTLQLNSTDIYAPQNATFDASLHGVAVNGTLVKTEVLIGREYQLWVAGTQITDGNKDSLISSNISPYYSSNNYLVRYNSETNTLRLSNVKIKYENSIINAIENLTIDIDGDCKLYESSSGNYSGIAIHSYTDFTIQAGKNNFHGAPDLTIGGVGGIYADRCNLTINNLNISMQANGAGIYGYQGLVEEVTINNSNILFYSSSQGAITFIKSLTLNGCAIEAPTGAAFSAADKAVTLDGEIVKDVLEIDIFMYPLYVCDVLVTSQTKDDILSDFYPGNDVTYDPESNTLTLKDVSIHYGYPEWAYENTAVIENSIPGLTINLIGENEIEKIDTLEYSYYELAAIYSTKDFIISGNGSLIATFDDGGAIIADNCNLTINDATVTARGAGGIIGNRGLNEVVTLNNATVKAEGSTIGSIASIKSLVLNDCVIRQPAGATFNALAKAIVLNEAVVTEEVVIERTGEVAISDAATTAAAVNIFPNPATDVLNINAEGFTHVELLNFLGQVVYSATMNGNELHINVSDLTAGTYFVKLQGDSNVATQKVVLY